MAMSLEKREKIAKERRNMILDSALTLFDENGYTNTSIGDIAELAGISKGLIYKYFKTKLDILKSYEDKIHECEVYVHDREDPRDVLFTFASRVLQKYEITGYHAPIRTLISCYMHGDIHDDDDFGFDFQNYGKIMFAETFQKGMDQGIFKAGNAESMGDSFWHMVIGYCVHMINSGLDLTNEDIHNMINIYCK